MTRRLAGLRMGEIPPSLNRQVRAGGPAARGHRRLALGQALGGAPWLRLLGDVHAPLGEVADRRARRVVARRRHDDVVANRLEEADRLAIDLGVGNHRCEVVARRGAAVFDQPLEVSKNSSSVCCRASQ